MNVQLEATETTTDKKLLILESTLQLIREYGFHGTAMSQIAQQSGVATGTIYHYFQSKDDLIIAIFKHSRSLLHQATFDLDDQKQVYTQRLANLWTNFVKFYVNHPDVLSFLEQFYSSPYIKRVISDETICCQDDLSLFLQEGIEKNHIRSMECSMVSAAFIGTAVSVAKRTNNGTFSFSQEHLDNMITILWNGIKK